MEILFCAVVDIQDTIFDNMDQNPEQHIGTEDVKPCLQELQRYVQETNVDTGHWQGISLKSGDNSSTSLPIFAEMKPFGVNVFHDTDEHNHSAFSKEQLQSVTMKQTSQETLVTHDNGITTKFSLHRS